MEDKWIEESDFFSEDRKASRKERKRVSAADRSKYKKTDRDKIGVVEAPEGVFRRGHVLSVASRGVIVDSDGGSVLCTIKGALKQERGLFKNLVVVGDIVLFEDSSEGEGVIAHVEERHSRLSRSDSLSHNKEQLIAANIDLVLITVSVVDPFLKPSLVDRYIISARKGGMEPIVVVNKVDLLAGGSEEQALFDEFCEAYAASGVGVIPVSTITGEGIAVLENVMKGRSSVFAGQSGVGKSSLINIITGLSLPVGETVRKTKKGSHTTSIAHLVALSFGGWCIDTPGIKSFGIWDLKREELARNFPDIDAIGKHCRFLDCIHVHEPGCSVRDAVESGDISKLRYSSYLGILEELDEEQRRR